MPDQDLQTYPTIDVHDMAAFVQKHAAASPDILEYLKAVDDILKSKDKETIKRAYASLQKFCEESGQLVWIGGLEGEANEVASNLGTHEDS